METSRVNHCVFKKKEKEKRPYGCLDNGFIPVYLEANVCLIRPPALAFHYLYHSIQLDNRINQDCMLNSIIQGTQTENNQQKSPADNWLILLEQSRFRIEFRM